MRRNKVSLLGDIGGTNARFAVQVNGEIAHESVLANASYADLAAAARHYYAQSLPAGLAHPTEAALAIAAPLTGDRVEFTNQGWGFSAAALRRDLGLDRLVLVNDFTALALALPQLGAGELQQVGGATATAGGTIALIGPGTGLGVSGLVRSASGWAAIAGEGGHVTLAAVTPREFRILELLRERFVHVSAERVISGPGLPILHAAICEVDGLPRESLSPEQVVTGGLAEDNGACRATLDQFCAWLGGVAGDLALTLGARGGVYVGGGIVPRLGTYFASSPFRARFEAKGRFGNYLAPIPVYVITARLPALRGCAAALEAAPGSHFEAA